MRILGDGLWDYYWAFLATACPDFFRGTIDSSVFMAAVERLLGELGYRNSSSRKLAFIRHP